MEPSTVLFLAANPVQAQPLQLGEECRAIERKMDGAKFRNRIRLVSQWAARPCDLLEALSDHAPSVLHFSGHGAGEQGLYFQSDDGSPVRVTSGALVEVMRDNIKLAVLNACFTEIQAKDLIAHIPCVIGMPDLIGDKAAIMYAAYVYRALACGKSVAKAHQHGIAALALHRSHDQTRNVEAVAPNRCQPHVWNPTLLTRSGTDAHDVYIVHGTENSASAQNRDAQGYHARNVCVLTIKATLQEFDEHVIARVRAELRRLSKDVSLEIIDIDEGSVRLTLSLSPEAANVLLEQVAAGELGNICEFEVSSLELPESAGPEKTASDAMNLDVSNSAEAERNFYLQLLDLGTALEPEPLLEQTLATLAAASGAKAAYFELRDHDDNGDTPPRYWKAHRCSDRAIASIRASIIPQTLAEGWTIVLPSTNSSLRDPDVSSDEIHVALCAPIGLPPLGFVYLQGVHSDVSFAVRNRGMIEVLASQLAMIADRLSSRQNRAGQIGATTEIRKRFRCEELVGHSPAFARMLREAALAAPLHTPVLIAGGSGTGKSVLARAIASNSARASGPYVNFHCVTIPHLLFVSELFGLGPAAHSGAPRGSYGKVAEANGGTLFLDEISEMSLDAQAKLLQLLQEHCYYPPGATTPVVADVRVICATNMDLIAQVERGAFLDDLYYRLAVLPIVVPSLDERRDDIPELVERFCAEFCARYHLVALRPTRRALMACREAQWLGNVRELANAINAAVMLAVSEHAPAIDHYHVFPEMARSGDPLTDREAAERRDLVEALARNDWSIPRAAVDLGLSRTLVHHLMGSLGIRRPSDED